MKPCAKCFNVKAAEQFPKNQKMASGLDSHCKECRAAYKSKRRQEIKAEPKVIPQSKDCGGCKASRPSSDFCTERGMPDGLSRICRDCRSEKHYKNHASDPEAYRAKARASNAKRSKDPSFITHKRVSARVGEWLGTKKGGRSCFGLLGYTLPELRVHLERQFLKGMSWENIGDWHIDHIIPLAAFTASSADDPVVQKAWALPNLRPLWAIDNMRKHTTRTSLL